MTRPKKSQLRWDPETRTVRKKPKPEPRPRSGKHLHGGVLVRAPELERQQWKRWAKRAGVTRVDYLRVGAALLSDLPPDEVQEALAILDADARKAKP